MIVFLNAREAEIDGSSLRVIIIFDCQELCGAPVLVFR